MIRSDRMRLGVMVSLVAAGGIACSDSGPTVAPSEARISIADEISAGAAVPLFYASVNGALVAISPDTVESLEIEFTEPLAVAHRGAAPAAAAPRAAA